MVSNEVLKAQIELMGKVTVRASNHVIDRDVIGVWRSAVADWTDAQFEWTARRIMTTERFFPDLATFLKVGREYETIVTPVRGRDFGMRVEGNSEFAVTVCFATGAPWYWDGFRAWCERIGDDRAFRRALQEAGKVIVDGQVVDSLPQPVADRVRRLA